MGTSYSFLVGPLVAAGALGVIILICRWVFSTTHRDDRTARRLAKVRSRGDYGLLVPVARVRTRDDAEMLRAVLAGAGIRCTIGTAEGTAGGTAGGPAERSAEAERPGLAVLVFRTDADRARDLVASRP